MELVYDEAKLPIAPQRHRREEKKSLPYRVALKDGGSSQSFYLTLQLSRVKVETEALSESRGWFEHSDTILG